MRSHPVTVPLVVLHQSLLAQTDNAKPIHKLGYGIHIGHAIAMMMKVYEIVKLRTHLKLHLALDHLLVASAKPIVYARILALCAVAQHKLHIATVGTSRHGALAHQIVAQLIQI